MKKFIVSCMEDNSEMLFLAKNPHSAMEKALYTLNLKQKDASAAIKETKSGMHLFMEHCNKTYAVRTCGAE